MAAILSELWTNLVTFAEGALTAVVFLSRICPPLVGLIAIALAQRLVPARWLLLYWLAGLTVLIVVCRKIVADNPAPGPDFGVISAGLFALVATPVALALAVVAAIRLLRKRPATGTESGTL